MSRLVNDSRLPQWTLRLGRHFFTSDRAGQEVLLYIDRRLLDIIGADLGGADGLIQELTRPQLKLDNGTLQRGDFCRQAIGICEQIWGSCRKLDGDQPLPNVYPTFLPYLAALVAAVASREDAFELKVTAYYPHVADFLKKPQPYVTAGFGEMSALWQSLEKWTNETTREQFGRFTVRRSGPKHVGVPLSQVVISQPERDALPILAEDAGIMPGQQFSDERLRWALARPRAAQYFTLRTQRVLAAGPTDFLHQQLLAIVRDDLARWDGTVPETPEEPPTEAAKRPSLVGLRVCAHPVGLGGWRFRLRFRAGRELPDADVRLTAANQLLLLANALPGGQGWTTELVTDEAGTPFDVATGWSWRHDRAFTDTEQGFRARFRGAEVRLFRPAPELGLLTTGWLEADELSATGDFYLAVLSTSPLVTHVRTWGPRACAAFQETAAGGLPNGWVMFKGRAPRVGCAEVPGLLLNQTLTVQWEGGVRTGRVPHEFFAFALPYVRVLNAPTGAVIQLNDTPLTALAADPTLYALPLHVLQSAALQAGHSVRVCLAGAPLVERPILLGAGQRVAAADPPYGRDTAGNVALPTAGRISLGAHLSGSSSGDEQPFTRPFPTHLAAAGSIVFLGEDPRQVCRYPQETLPLEWQPVWALVKRGKDDWLPVFCGDPTRLDQALPRGGKPRSEWTWVNRRITTVPTLPPLKALWQRYQQADYAAAPQSPLATLSAGRPTITATTHLLHVLSARGKMSLPEFNAALDGLLSANPEKRARLEDRTYRFLYTQVAGMLDALGHCELNYDQRTVAVCPPTLALLPTAGLPRAVLTGARDADLEAALIAWVKAHPQEMALTELPQPQPELPLPPALLLEAVALAPLHELATALGLRLAPEAPPAWRLLHFSATLSGETGVAAGWQFAPMADFTDRKKRPFWPTRLSFRDAPLPAEAPYPRLIEYTHPRTQQRRHFLWRSPTEAAEVERNWARYAVLAETRTDVLCYDDRYHALAVPDTLPLPTVLARALVLSSGLVPRTVRVAGTPHLLYQAVPPAIAQGMAAKLSQRPLRADFKSVLTDLTND